MMDTENNYLAMRSVCPAIIDSLLCCLIWLFNMGTACVISVVHGVQKWVWRLMILNCNQ